MKEGFVFDYISGQKIKATPEEVEAVQVFSRILVEDYGYSKAQIQTRPQWCVKSRPSEVKKQYPVDIAVFENERKAEDGLQIVVECKRKTRKDGLSQLKDYLKFSNARLGVWFNGDERLFIQKTEKNGKVFFSEIPNIPRKHERLEDIGKFKRKDLVVPHNLKVIFRTIRNHLAGNTVGTTRDEVLAKQLMNIIFCKIYDEKFTPPDARVSFRAGVGESEDSVASRIKNLFNRVKPKYKEVVDFNDEIKLDDKSITYVVGELQNYCLTASQRDVVADAFETFINSTLKGGSGQFFTPRNVIKLMVEIVNPQPDQVVLDPACGSGGFLVESLKHMWKGLERQADTYGWTELALQEEKIAAAIQNIKGLEKDEFLSQVAKAYMAIVGDGKGGIFCEDSLAVPSSWDDKTRQHIELEKCDIVLTNPPFGKDIGVVGEDKLAQYELAKKWQLDADEGHYRATSTRYTKMRPEILFIERCLQLVKKGGLVGIVLPETFFHAPRSRYVMQFIEQHNIKCLIDLPHNTFRPHNNAKCVAVVLQKSTPQELRIQLAVAQEMGHDHQGKPIYRWNPKTQKIDTTRLWDDVQTIMAELQGKKNKHVFSIESRRVKQKKIFVPRYYWKTKQQEVEAAALDKGLHLVSMKKLIDEGVVQAFDGHGSPPAEYKGRGEVPYIRVKDIVNWEVYKDPTSRIPYDVYKKHKGHNKTLQAEDVLYVRRGSYRIGSVAMLSPYDTQVLLTRELLVLRVNKKNKYHLTPYYLLYLLSHRLVEMQAFSKVLIETTLPNISDRWQELKLPMFDDTSMAQSVAGQVLEVIKAKWAAIEKLNEIKKAHGELVT